MDRTSRSDSVDPEPTLDVLADLQAGLLDDGTAARIESALRAETHSRLRVAIAFVGALAAIVAVTVGTVTLLRAPLAAPQVAQPTQFPLTDTQLLDLLHHPPAFGPLTELRRRASCLAGLDYPASTAPLGATIIVWSGEPVVILLLPEDTSKAVRAVAVRASCNAADTGLLAETTFQHS